jgi:hypothetical protein
MSKYSFFSITGVACMLLLTQNCADTASKQQNKKPETVTAAVATVPLDPGFNQYWYAGVAELCTYDVVQERYGEERMAEQVNIFVTEDLSQSKQVKLDQPEGAGNDRVPVLKLNCLRKFETGIYDYSIMQSVFTPVTGAPTLKTTTSVQDWCGHIFTQSNLLPNGGYRVRGLSYFESEGDLDVQLPLTLLEDELWTRIRLNPSSIPTGKISLIPAAIYVRLRHKPVAVAQAEISLQKGAAESILQVQYTDIPRSLSIRFETAAPYKILGWEETHNGRTASKGTLKATRKSAYWGEHENRHHTLRDSLRLGH